LISIVEIATSFDFLVQVNCSFNVGLKLGYTFKSQSKPLGEEVLDTLNISLEVELGIDVTRGCHLREINNSDRLVISDHQVEFVEVSVDETMLCKANNLFD
jgi:hypothetical protein